MDVKKELNNVKRNGHFPWIRTKISLEKKINMILIL